MYGSIGRSRTPSSPINKPRTSFNSIILLLLLGFIFYTSHVILKDDLQLTPTSQDGQWQPGDHHGSYYALDKKINVPLRRGTYTPSADKVAVRSKAAVSCDVPQCSTMGTDILRRGGSAVDAAITVSLCIGSINGFSSGIGGGGFMVVKDPHSKDLSFNFREAAPGAAHKDMYKDDPKKAQFGGLAVAVPGELDGLYEAFKRYSSGKLTWKQLFEPVIQLNRKGWVVGKALELALEATEGDLRRYGNDWSWLYVEGEDGDNGESTNGLRRAKAGDILTRNSLARTLEIIANNGSSAVFYDPNGPIAPHLVSTIQKTGGVMTVDDFAKYHTIVEEPLIGSFYGKQVLTATNPTSGPALLLGLNIIDRFRDSKDAKGSPRGDSDPVSQQRLIEAMKWVSAGRTELGDPSDVSNKARVKEIMSQEWCDKVVANISDYHTRPWQDYQPAYEVEDPAGTAHFSIIDENDMAVSMTTTVNLLFGSLVYDVTTGIILNSEMDDFSIPSKDNAYELKPSIYNYIAPYKRPLSSTTPTIVYNKESGHVELVIGAAGGSRIVTAVFQGIVRKYAYGLSLLQTISFPRLHHQLLPETAYFETGGRKHIGEALKKRGHNVEYWIPRSVMNAVSREDNGDLHAVGDYWRKGGGGDGY